MMFDPMLYGEIGEQHKRDMLRQAQTYHLRRVTRGNREIIYRRWLALAADLLIAGGTRIKRHCDQAAQARRLSLSTPALDWEHLRAR